MVSRRAIKTVILPTAKQDLREIVDFIARDSIKYAKREKLLIVAFIDKLKNLPEIGTSFNYQNIVARQSVFRNYLIIYRQRSESLIEILTIHHHARLFSNNVAFKDTD